MDAQTFQTVATIFGALISIIGFCVAWWVNTIWQKSNAQQEEVNRLTLKLAERYVTKDDLHGAMRQLNEAIEKLFDKIDEIRNDLHSSQRAAHRAPPQR